MPASSSRALTRSEADLLIAQMQEQLRLMQAARPTTPAPETQPDPREESGSESESEESEEEEKAVAGLVEKLKKRYPLLGQVIVYRGTIARTK